MTEAQTFNLKTHHFDGRGRLLHRDPYALYIEQGVKYFERPIGSGNLFDEAGTPAGRRTEDGKITPGAAHVEFTPPAEVTIDSLAAENRALQLELASIRAEQEEKMKSSSPAADAAKPAKGDKA